MLDPTEESHFPGPLAPMQDVLRYYGTTRDLIEIREARGEALWEEYWEALEEIVTDYIVGRCALLNEMDIRVHVLEDMNGEKYLETKVNVQRNPTPPIDRPKEIDWHLN